MDEALIWLLFVGYGMCALFTLAYALAQVHLTFYFRRAIRAAPVRPQPQQPSELPSVTVQLPIFNELPVVERLLRSVTALRYPRERLEIQVLDDSTDETKAVAARLIAAYQARGYRINHLCRLDRVGFKAGALRYGYERASGEFFAIFDADFIPPPDFLLQTLPYFNDPAVGMVQTRWKYLNQDYSLLSRLQSLALDAHFTVEHMGRAFRNLFINFNGTAGIWRRACIEDAGGWHSDTLTEDLDLSYRAQLRGWHFVYLRDVVSLGELPVAMDAVKTQQYRWTKGAAECAKKNLPAVLCSPRLSLVEKLHAFFHHTNSVTYLCLMTFALLSIPLLLIKQNGGGYKILYVLSGAYCLSSIFLTCFYWHTWMHNNPGGGMLRRFAGTYPLFLMMYMGLSLYNAKAVVLGYLGSRSPFIRTPKFNITDRQQCLWKNPYMITKLNWEAVVELGLAALFSLAAAAGVWLGELEFLPFHLMLALGFAFVGSTSLLHRVAH